MLCIRIKTSLANMSSPLTCGVESQNRVLCLVEHWQPASKLEGCACWVKVPCVLCCLPKGYIQDTLWTAWLIFEKCLIVTSSLNWSILVHSFTWEGGSYLNIESLRDNCEWKNNAEQICWRVQERRLSCLCAGKKKKVVKLQQKNHLNSLLIKWRWIFP